MFTVFSGIHDLVDHRLQLTVHGRIAAKIAQQTPCPARALELIFLILLFTTAGDRIFDQIDDEHMIFPIVTHAF